MHGVAYDLKRLFLKISEISGLPERRGRATTKALCWEVRRTGTSTSINKEFIDDKELLMHYYCLNFLETILKLILGITR